MIAQQRVMIAQQRVRPIGGQLMSSMTSLLFKHYIERRTQLLFEFFLFKKSILKPTNLSQLMKNSKRGSIGSDTVT